jgi:hypothetical protein
MKGWFCAKAFPQGGGLLDEVGVVAGLRAVESGFQQAAVADAGGPAVALYLVVMDGEHFGEGEISRSFSQLLVAAVRADPNGRRKLSRERSARILRI